MKGTFILCKDRINYTNEMSVEDKAGLLDSIMNYQNWLDLWVQSYAVKIVFSHIRAFFEKQQENYDKIIERNQKNGGKWGRPIQKKPKKPSGLSNNPDEPKETLTHTDTHTVLLPTDVGKDISNDISLTNSTTDITILNNNETWQIQETLQEEKKVYGKEDINFVMDIISKANDWVMDWTKARNRQFAWHLIRKIKEIPSVKEEKYTRESILEMIINIAKDDKYSVSKITSPEKVYHELGTLMATCRGKLKESNNRKQF